MIIKNINGKSYQHEPTDHIYHLTNWCAVFISSITKSGNNHNYYRKHDKSYAHIVFIIKNYFRLTLIFSKQKRTAEVFSNNRSSRRNSNYGTRLPLTAHNWTQKSSFLQEIDILLVNIFIISQK